MTAIVSAPVSVLTNALDSLRFGPTQAEVRKQKFTEEEKQKKIFDTAYEPNLKWWEDNQADYVKPSDDPLPAGYPEETVDPSVWDGKQLINQPEKWLYRFTPDDVDLINEAYDHFDSLDVDKNQISRETFPIPADSALYKALEEAVESINFGVGLRVLRGLPVDSWDRTKQLVVFAGISAYIGARRLKQGTLNVAHLRDITDLPEDKRPAITVKGQTSGNQVFHNDGVAGIIGLITLGVAETGGLSQLSSTGQTYNDLAKHRRDVLRELAKDDWVNQFTPGGKSIAFKLSDKQVIFNYGRRPFFGFYEADASVPPLPTEKHLALDALHFTAEKYSLDLDLQKGDLEFFNNLTVFHGRTWSQDSKQNQRHLVRVWLENKGQVYPEKLAETFAKSFVEQGTGWPLEAWDSDPFADSQKVETGAAGY